MNSPPPPSRGASATGVMSGIPFSGVPVGSVLSPSLSNTSGVSPSSMTNSGLSSGGGGGVGATQKHLEFQLQRERSTVGSLQEKIKALHAQVAQLEQEKAELRREKIGMAEENRKNSRAEEHWSTLKKDVEAKEKVCRDERQRAAEAKAETEEVRRKAQHSISQWLKAESSWGEREAALQAQLKELGERYQKIQEEEEMLRREKNTIDASYHREREKAQKAEQRCVAMESDIQMQGEQLEKHQNKAFSYETEIAALRRSAAQLEDAMEQREAERHGFQLEQDRLVKENEQLAHTISSYQDRLNKEKTVQMNLSQEKALQDCDVQNAKKEAQHLTRLLESERKECALAQQREAQLAGEVEEWKSRLQVAKNELKTKETVLREKVLLTTQLQMEVQKGEAQMTLQKAEAHQRGLEMEQMTVTLHTQQHKTERIEEALACLHTQLESAHQEVAMVREQGKNSQAEQAAQLAAHQAEMEDLQKNLSARQEVVEALTTQLQSLNQQQSHLHSCLEKNSISAHHQLSQQQLLQEAWREKEECFGVHAGVERVSLIFKGLLHPLVQSMHRAEETHHLAVEQCTSRFTRLEEDYRRLVAEHSDAQERLEMLLEENEVLRQQCEVVWSEKEKTWKATERALSQQILTLQEEKEGAVGTAAEREQAMAAMAAMHQAFVEEKVQHVQAQWMHRQQLAIGTALESYESLFSAVVQRKIQYVWESVCFLTQRAVREACTRREKQASLEEKCAGMEQLLSESNDLLRQQHQHSEETFHSLHAQLRKLEEKLALSQREGHLAQNQLHCTVEHWQQSKKEWEETLATQGADFQHRLTSMTDEIQKVRKGLQYELSRKTEYKVALERVKRYRAEEENHHFGVKEAVTRETEKANQEILYWREQYQLLKHTFQDFKRRHRAEKKAGITEEEEEEEEGGSRCAHSSSNDSPSPSFSPSPPPSYFSTSPPRNVEKASAEGPQGIVRTIMQKTKKRISESGYTTTSPSASPQVPSRLTLSLEPVTKRARMEGENEVDPTTAAEAEPLPHPQETNTKKKKEKKKEKDDVPDHDEGKKPQKEVETCEADRAMTIPPPALRPLFSPSFPASTSPPPTTGASSFPSTTLPYPSGGANRSAEPIPPPSLSPRGVGGHRLDSTAFAAAPVSPTPKETKWNASSLPSTSPHGGSSPSPSFFPSSPPPPPPPSVVDVSTTQWRERHGLRDAARNVSPTSYSPSPHPGEGEEPRFWRTKHPLQREGAVERASVVSSAASASSSAMLLGPKDPNRTVANEKYHLPMDPIPVAFQLPPPSCVVGENGVPNHFPPYPYPHRGPGGRGRIGSTPPPDSSSFSTSPPPSSPLQRPLQPGV